MFAYSRHTVKSRFYVSGGTIWNGCKVHEMKICMPVEVKCTKLILPNDNTSKQILHCSVTLDLLIKIHSGVVQNNWMPLVCDW
jgi:hypothetical protein